MSTEKDAIISPSHYRQLPSGVECIDVAQHFNFNIGNVIKYVWRAGLKTDNVVEDLEKAKRYLEFEIERYPKGNEAVIVTKEAANRFIKNHS